MTMAPEPTSPAGAPNDSEPNGTEPSRPASNDEAAAPAPAPEPNGSGEFVSSRGVVAVPESETVRQVQEGHLPDTHRPEGGDEEVAPGDAAEGKSKKEPRKQAGRKASRSGKLELRTAVTRTDLPEEQAPAAPEVGIQWYVVRVASGRESSVKKALERKIRELDLGEQIVAVHVPTESEVEVRDGKKKEVKRKLFPGYVILEMVLNEATQNAIRRTSGVGDFVALQPMSEREIEQISRVVKPKVAGVAKKPEIKIALNIGQKVKVKEGSFENFEGNVSDVNADKGVVKVQIEIFNRKVEVELEYWQVEAL